MGKENSFLRDIKGDKAQLFTHKFFFQIEASLILHGKVRFAWILLSRIRPTTCSHHMLRSIECLCSHIATGYKLTPSVLHMTGNDATQ